MRPPHTGQPCEGAHTSFILAWVEMATGLPYFMWIARARPCSTSHIEAISPPAYGFFRFSRTRHTGVDSRSRLTLPVLFCDVNWVLCVCLRSLFQHSGH